MTDPGRAVEAGGGAAGGAGTATGQLRRTPSQTVGPFFGFALPWPDGPLVVPEATPGSIRIAGRLLDGAGEPIPDGLIEIWHADPEGVFPDAEVSSRFRGFGRCPTDVDGRFWFATVKPGRVSGLGGAIQAPHIDVSVFARGLLTRLVTRIYFDDEPEANAADPILALIADSAARSTLIARSVPGGYEYDIRLQGDGETVFFDF